MIGMMLLLSLALAAEVEDLCYDALPDPTGCEVLFALDDPYACEDLNNLVVSCVDQLGESESCWLIDDVLLDTCGEPAVETQARWWRGDDDDDDDRGPPWWRDDDDDDGGPPWWRDDDDDDGGPPWWRDDDDDDGWRHDDDDDDR